MTFRDPTYFYLLILIPLLGIFAWKRWFRMQSRFRFSTLQFFQRVPRTLRSFLARFLWMIRLGVLALLIIALARPQAGMHLQEVTTKGIDIMLVMDVSTSMLAEDFKPKNRIEASKAVAKEFVQGRKNDRIGVVIFAGEAFPQCPLTLDYGVVMEIIDRIQVAPPEWDGTAIGNGLATAVARLKNSEAKSKVIILLTDGVNNAGEVDPMTAAEIAETFNMRIYTIGVGTSGYAVMPRQTPWGVQKVRVRVEIDEDLLKRIAQKTGGLYFRATNTEKLREIYQQISEMEKTKIEVKEFTRYKEKFALFAGLALMLLVVEIVLQQTWLRRLP